MVHEDKWAKCVQSILICDKKKPQQQATTGRSRDSKLLRLPRSLFRSHFGPLCYSSPGSNLVNRHILLLVGSAGNDFYTNRRIRFALGEMRPTTYFSDLTVANDLLPAGGSGEPQKGSRRWRTMIVRHRHEKQTHRCGFFYKPRKNFIQGPSLQNLTGSANVVRYSIIFPLSFFILDLLRKISSEAKRQSYRFLGSRKVPSLTFGLSRTRGDRIKWVGRWCQRKHLATGVLTYHQ